VFVLFIGNLKRRDGRRARAVQQSLHGILLSNLAFGSVGGVLERIADFAQMKSSNVSVALVVPFRCATPENKWL